MLFFTLSNRNINLTDYKFNWKLYTTIEPLSTIKRVWLVEKKIFIVVALDLNNKIFISYVIFFTSSNLNINSYHKAQIASLIVDEVFIVVLAEYTDFINIFSFNFVAKLQKYIRITNYLIDLVKDQQSSYRPIYSLKPIKLKTLKTYIGTNLANSFIKLFKSFIGTFIFFI